MATHNQSEEDFIGPGEIEEELNVLERIKARFGVDDDFLAALLSNQLHLARIERQQNALLEQFAQANSPDSVSQAFPIEFSTNIPANTGVDDPHTVQREMPFDGQTVTFVAGWPDGANNGVGIQLRRGEGERLFPRNKEDDFVAANDFTHPFTLRSGVFDGEMMEAVFANVDTSNDHFVNAILIVEEKELPEMEPGEGDNGN